MIMFFIKRYLEACVRFVKVERQAYIAYKITSRLANSFREGIVLQNAFNRKRLGIEKAKSLAELTKENQAFEEAHPEQFPGLVIK